MREFTKLDRLKIFDYVEEAVNEWGGKILRCVHMRTVVKFNIADCAIVNVEECVNQRLGKYAYPWESWSSKPNLLKVGWRVRG